MATILKLQGLDVKAGTGDIRKFFECFHIPEGGVYILGGSRREAFIAFNTERDAQLAMQLTGNVLKGSKVTLHISNMAEMEWKLKSLLKRKKPSPAQLPVNTPNPSSDTKLHLSGRNLSSTPVDLSPTTTRPLDPNNANLQQPLYPDTSNQQPPLSLDSSTAFLLGICTVLQGLQSSHQRENEILPQVDFTKADNTVVSEVKTQEQSLESTPGYVRLFGLPASTTKEEICQFFRGLAVQEAIVNVKLGLGHVCLVKFANMQDASEALLFNQQLLGTISVEVRGATEKMWTSALQECENAWDAGERVKRKRSPFRETANHKRKSPSVPRTKSGPVSWLPMKPAIKPRPDGDSTTAIPPTKEYIVKVCNLPQTMTKTEIKELFRCTAIPHKHVLHLLDKESNRTDTAFLIFKRIGDYDYAMNLSGCHVGSGAIEVSSITRLMMKEMMSLSRPRNQNHCLKTGTNKKTFQLGNYDSLDTPEKSPSTNLDTAAQTCLFVRNMPADVQEGQIKSLFCEYELRKDNIFMLRDSDGKSNGEAVVQFKSSKLATLAQRLHGQDFLGSRVLLTVINERQMEDILGQEMSEVEH